MTKNRTISMLVAIVSFIVYSCGGSGNVSKEAPWFLPAGTVLTITIFDADQNAGLAQTVKMTVLTNDFATVETAFTFPITNPVIKYTYLSTGDRWNLSIAWVVATTVVARMRLYNGSFGENNSNLPTIERWELDRIVLEGENPAAAVDGFMRFSGTKAAVHRSQK